MKDIRSLKMTGITRNVDSVGRIVIPAEIRQNMGIDEDTPLEIFMDDAENMVLRKYQTKTPEQKAIEALKEVAEAQRLKMESAEYTIFLQQIYSMWDRLKELEGEKA